jgi:hypothetical protein
MSGGRRATLMTDTRGRFVRAGAEVLGVAALASVWTALLAWPVLGSCSSRLFGVPIVGWHYDPYVVMALFAGRDGLSATSQIATDVPGRWLAHAWGPVAAHNVLVLLSFPLAAACAYLLGRQLRLSRPAAAVSGLLFAFAPFHVAHAAYHVHVAQTQWIALYMCALWRCQDDPRTGTVCVLGVAGALAVLSNYYAALILGTITPVAVVAYAWANPRRSARVWHRAGITAAALGFGAVAAGGAIALMLPSVLAARSSFGFPIEDLYRYSARWWAYLVPAIQQPWFGPWAGDLWKHAGVDVGLLEQQVFVGWTVAGLAVLAVVAWFRDRREPGVPAVGAVPVLVCVAVVALACSLSPSRTIAGITVQRPSGWLHAWLPMFRAFARFGVVVQLMSALLAGIGLEWLVRVGPKRMRVLAAVGVAFAFAEYAVMPNAASRDILPTSAHRWLAATPPSLRVLDCATPTVPPLSVDWLMGPRLATRHGDLDDCAEPQFSSKLAAQGFSALLLRGGMPDARWLDRQPAEGLARLRDFGDGTIYRVTSETPQVFTGRLIRFSPREYAPGLTWRWMGNDAAWTIVNPGPQDVVVRLDLQLWTFDSPRRLQSRLDEAAEATTWVDPERRWYRLGPFLVTPGRHTLSFRSVEPALRPADVLKNGDTRDLSVAFGDWRWLAEQPVAGPSAPRPGFRTPGSS